MIILGYLRLSPVSKVWLGELFELLARNLDNGDDVVVDVDDDDGGCKDNAHAEVDD